MRFLSLVVSFAHMGWGTAQSFLAAGVQNTTFNSTHGPYNPSTAKARIAEAGLSAELSEAVLTALNFERSNWAGTSVRLDPFYTDLPTNWTDAPAGSVIKVEQYTNTSLYTIAATLAISRFIFTTKNLNGTVVPASAYVLWPWLSRTFDRAENDRVPVIGWAHGTSGWSGECGPSHLRSLWYQFQIYTAATQGYAVVAPDFAGLGLDHDGQGNFISAQYLASKAHGNDVLYAVQAAQKAWPVLGSRYVVMGHSQGGGAAWGAASVLAGNGSDIEELRKGYLGSFAGSPWTSFDTALSFLQQGGGPSFLVSLISTGVASIFPSFKLSDWLTEKGVRAVELLQDLQGCSSVAAELLSSSDLVRDDWDQSWYASAFNSATSNIAQPIVGPLLVLQGTSDSKVNATGTSDAVDATCKAYPDAQIEYVEFEGVSHSAVMFAGQQVWLNWIADRFEDRKVESGCHRKSLKPVRSTSDYQKDRNWHLLWNQYPYGVA